MHRQHIPVVIVGHKAHGKSSLVESMCRANGTRGPRGALNNIRVAQVHTPARRYTLLDIPGGSRSVKAALRGGAVAQAAVVVVSATSGPQAQTRDHLLAAVASGLSTIIIVINDERGDAELVDACALLVRGVINDLGEAGDDVAVVTGAVTDADVGAAVIDALDAQDAVVADDSAAPVMRVLFSHPGRGRARGRSDEAVASGRLMSGTLSAQERVVVVGMRHPRGTATTALARIDRLEVQGEAHDVVRAGEQVGVQLLFEGQAPLVCRQSVLIVGMEHSPARAVRVRLRLRPKAIGGRHRPLRAGFVCLAWLGSSSVVCTVIPVGDGDSDVVVDPDASFDAVLVFGATNARYAVAGDVVCLSGDGGLIADGRVVDVVDDAPFRERLRALQGARVGSRRALRLPSVTA